MTHAQRLLLAALAFTGVGAASAQLADVSFSHGIALPGGGEIVAYTSDNFTLATTFSTPDGLNRAVRLYNFAGSSSSVRATVDFAVPEIFGAASNIFSVSSVALDPAGRGFGVATIIPTANTSTFGKLAFFNYNTGAVLHSIDVGYHPDSVRFSNDGSRLIIANEGEANPGTSAANDGTNAAGSLSVVNLAGVTLGNLASSVTSATTRDFSAPNLASGVSLAGVRNPYLPALGNPGNSTAQQALNTTVPNTNLPANQVPADIEPEYAVIDGDKAYVSLQENNAIAVLDLNTNQYTAIHKLSTITQTIDATDNDSAANINRSVAGMPMPDTIATVTIAGQKYILTANEGDARIDDRDATRYGNSAMNALLDPTAHPDAAGAGLRANGALGRLNISRVDGDTDFDGDIDVITMFGTRSVSLWNADTGAFVADTGNLEVPLLSLDPTRHNINRDGTAIDNRSDDKGPEPEALVSFSFDGRTYVAIGLERQNGVLIYELTDALTFNFVDYVNGANNALISPESLIFIPSAQSPDGIAYLLTGFEGPDSGANAGIGVYALTAIPEPASATALAGAALLAWGATRRRRRAA